MSRLLGMLAVLVALLPSLALAHGEDPPGALHVDTEMVEQGSVSTVDRPIVVEGRVSGDVTSISGEIIIRGVVEGDVVSWGGDIKLEPQARVQGHVMAVAGVIYREGPASIAGQVFNGKLERAGFASLIPGVAGEELSLGARLNLALALFVIGVAIAALLGHIWSRAVASSTLLIQQVPLRAFALGMLTTLLAAVVVGGLTLLLAFMLVGLLAVPALLLAAHLPFLAGLAGAGRALEQWLGVERAHGVAGIALLLLPALMLGVWSPLAGGLAFHLVAAPGVGALLLLRSAALRFHQA